MLFRSGFGSPIVPLLLAAAAHDLLRRRLALLSRLVALGRLAPRCHGMPAARGLPLTAAQRVIDRVHRHAADLGPSAAPARSAGLAERQVLVIEVSDLADRRLALGVHPADLGAREAQQAEAALAGHQLHPGAGCAGQLPALPRLELHVVDRRPERDRGQRQRVAGLHVRARSGLDRVAHRQPVGGQDVTLLAVGVMDQSDVRRAVRIVFDGRHLAGNSVLVALEVDSPVATLVSTPAPAHRHMAVAVPPAARGFGLDQRALGLGGRDLGAVVHRTEPRARRYGLELLDSHRVPWAYRFSYTSIASPSARVTMAFFQSARRPEKRPIEWIFPIRFWVRTFSTLTWKSSSIASAICRLFAPGSTANTNWFDCSCWRVDFSVKSDRRMIRRLSIRGLRGSRIPACSRPRLPRPILHHHHVVTQDVERGGVAELLDRQPGHVASGAEQVVVVSSCQEQHPALGVPPGERLDQPLGLRLVERLQLDYPHQTFGRLIAERRGERDPPDLLRHALVPVLRGRAEDRAATLPQRRAVRARPGPPRPLLPPRLGAAAADEGAGLRGGRARPIVGPLSPHRLVYRALVDFRAEPLVGALDLPRRRSRERVSRRFGHHPPRLLIRRMALRAPGTEPLRNTSCWSASTFNTSRLRIVVRRLPVCPGSFRFLNVFAGSAA